MTTVLGLLLALAAAVWVALPFFRRDLLSGDPAAKIMGNRGRWERQKVEAYAAIKEAEFDLRMGKLSNADFAIVRDKYGKQALEAIAALDDERKGRAAAGGRKPSRFAYCPNCGTTLPAQANFCPGCGKSILDAVA
ncbi:MAG: zinc ribbon domain-containing protein [Deltaproteobacteria bacterium]|nr:zinc ribbon domain-containing protein [Planctomycetota bacterium]MBI3782902.1 zinc ribbon domain-containing protein [Deltaproteobacteria bacterium]